MKETWIQFLGWEDSLEKGKATHSSILAWRIPDYIAHGVAKSWPQLSNFHFPSKHKKKKFIGNGFLNEIRCIQEWILPSAIMIRVQHQFLWWLSGKESACNTGDVGSVPGSGGSPGEGNGNPLQYSGLENPTDREAWWLQFRDLKRVGTQLSD